MSGDVRYPGWCCRQIAAQLSQALFTMAELHAQVSDLREENRQLKIKIENIGIRQEQEVSSPSKSEENFVASVSSSAPALSELQNFTMTRTDCSETEFELEQKPRPLEQSCRTKDSPFVTDLRANKHASNVTIAQVLDESNGNPFCASPLLARGDLKCDKCECSFLSSDMLTIHQAVHIGRSFHVCKVCNAMFLLKADLNRHWTTHPNIKQHICQLCGKAYTSKNNYKLHIKTHTGVGLYPCEVCGKAFHSENHLNVHRRIHTGERPYECQYCDKSFTQKSGLINHTRLHTGEKPFLCPSCPKAFTQKSNLNFHLSKHHPVSEEMQILKPQSTEGEMLFSKNHTVSRNVPPQQLSDPHKVLISKNLPVNGATPPAAPEAADRLL